jgi:hypothetical protein
MNEKSNIRVIVVLENRIYVYNFSDLKLLDSIDTFQNPKGLCCLSSEKDFTVLACPDKQKGNVKVNIYGRIINSILEESISHTIAAH